MDEKLKQQVRDLQARVAELEGRKPTTYIGIVQDKSGSMAGRVEPTISGFNEYVQELQRKAKDDNISYRLTLTQFDTTYRTVYENEPLGNVKSLTEDDYVPSGMTALLDAVADTVEIIEKQMSAIDNALIVVMTDGHENSSLRFNPRQIADLIKRKEATDRWTFVYLGADQDAWGGGTAIGISGTNTFAYANTSAGIQDTYRRLAGSTHMHASAGGQATASFAADYMDGTNQANVTFKPVKDDEDDDGDAGVPVG